MPSKPSMKGRWRKKVFRLTAMRRNWPRSSGMWKRLSHRAWRLNILPGMKYGKRMTQNKLASPEAPFSSFRYFLLWCDVCGQEVETSFEAWKVPFRKRHGRVTYARRVDLNLQPVQMVGR